MNLVNIVKKEARKVILTTLATGMAFSAIGCDTLNPFNSKKKNEPPETKITDIDTKFQRNNTNFYFNASGYDSDGRVRGFKFRIDGSKEFSDWKNIEAIDRDVIGEDVFCDETLELPEGDYTLEVKAIDNEGKEDPTPDTQNFTVDYENQPPNTVISHFSTEPGERGSLSFFVVGEDEEDWVTRETKFRILGSEEYADWTTTEAQDNFLTIPKGTYTLEIKAVDSEGLEDPTPEIIPFTIEGEEQELITEPIEILPDNTRVFQGTTPLEGLVRFLDETADDGEAKVKVTDIENQQPVRGMQVAYKDYPLSKVFTAIDPNGELLPSRGIFPHNSIHLLPTASVRRGIVNTQTINDEEGFRAFYIWYTNPGIATNPYQLWEYETTIDESTRIEAEEFNQSIISVLSLVDILTGEGLVEIFGIDSGIGLEDLGRELDPYNKEFSAERWDQYRLKQGTELTGTTIVGDILLVPSNIPTVEDLEVTINETNVKLTWHGLDRTKYRMPFSLPGTEDLTATKLGSSEYPDLTYSYTLKRNSEIVKQETQEQTEVTLEGLTAGNYSFELSVRDEVDNVSTDTLNFEIGREIILRTIEVLETYKNEEFQYLDGLTFDGNNFWFIEPIKGESSTPLYPYTDSIVHRATRELTSTFSFEYDGYISDLAWHNNELYGVFGNNLFRFDNSGNIEPIRTFPDISLKTIESDGYNLWAGAGMGWDDVYIKFDEDMNIGVTYPKNGRSSHESFVFDGSNFWRSYSDLLRNGGRKLIKLSRTDMTPIEECNNLPLNFQSIAYENNNFWALSGKEEGAELTRFRINY